VPVDVDARGVHALPVGVVPDLGGHAGGPAALQGPQRVRQPVLVELDVVVDEGEHPAAGHGERLVVRLGEAEVRRVLDEDHAAALLQQRLGAVRRPVVDDDHLVVDPAAGSGPLHGGQAVREQVDPVPGHDDEADLHAVPGAHLAQTRPPVGPGGTEEVSQ
jgi:hypothetical protein